MIFKCGSCKDLLKSQNLPNGWQFQPVVSIEVESGIEWVFVCKECWARDCARAKKLMESEVA